MASSSSQPATIISTVVKSGNFAFDGETFSAHGHTREDPKRLKDILFPEKSWYMSQLQHYGIPFKTKDTVPTLRSLLEGAVKDGKCKKIPDDIQTLENEMRTSFDSMYKAKPKGKKAGAAETTSDKSSAAKPATVKQPAAGTAKKASGAAKSAATVLAAAKPTGAAASKQKVEKPAPKPKTITKAKSTPSLAKQVVASRPANPVIPSPPRRSKQTARKSTVFQTVETWPPRGSKNFPSTGNLYKDCTGEYEIVCRTIIEGWDDVEPSELRLVILIPDGETNPVGFFDFDVIEGMMKFSNSKTYVGSYPVLDSRPSDREAERDDNSMEWEPSHAAQGMSLPTYQQAMEESFGNHGKKSKSAGSGAKRRLYFQWRGQDAERFEGEIHYDNKHQVGYLEFDDAACSSFTGWGSFPSLGARMEFKGYKHYKETEGVDDYGRDWDQYSQAAYSHARAARWR